MIRITTHLYPFRVFAFLGVLAACGGGGGGGGGDIVVDTTPPPVPTGLAATTVSASQIDLTWTASLDAQGYKVYRNGTLVADRFGTTTYQDPNLTANTTYSYRVSAYDSAGNESDRSAEATARTLGTATVLLGSPANEFSRGMALDASGNLYVTGWTAGALDGQANPSGADLFVTKFTPSGTRLWTRLLGTTGVADPSLGMDLGNFGLNVAVDSGRNAVFVTGYTTAGMDGQSASGGRDVLLVRYDLDGQNKTTRLYGGPGDEAGNALAVDASGHVYVAGYASGTNGKDILLLKYDASLALQGVGQAGSTGDDAGTGVALLASGYAVFVTGLAGGPLPSATASSQAYGGGGDLFLARFDTQPQLQWTTLLGSPSLDAGLALAVIGNTVDITGVTAGTLPGQTSFGGNDILVASYSASGTLNWTAQLGTSADEVAYGITTDQDPGNVFITGFTSGSPSIFRPNSGLEDVFLMKFGFGGGTPFAITLAGTAAGDEGRAIVLRESDNTVYVLGHTAGNLDAEPNAGGYDLCLLTFSMAGDQR